MSDRNKKPGLPPKKRMRHDRHFVDELAQRMGEGFGKMIRVTAISSNLDQPRTNLGNLTDLKTSIEKHGILEPLLVRRRKGGYQLVSGERRFHAAMQVGLSEVPCIELTVSDEHALEIALVENLQRQNLSPFEEADGFVTLIEKYGYTHEQVAEAVGRSRVTVTETIRILNLPDDVREACRHADITAKGILLEISKAPSQGAMLQLVEEIQEHQLDRDAIRARRKELDGEKLEETPREIPSRPYFWRFKSPDRSFSLSLSFRTAREPKREEVIQTLEAIIDELRDEEGPGAE